MLFNDLQTLFIHVELSDRLIARGVIAPTTLMQYNMYREFLQERIKLDPRNPKKNRTEAMRIIAQKYKISEKTVRRYIEAMES